METYKQMIDGLSEQLLFCCKQKKDKPIHLKKAEDVLESGAEVNYKNSRPIFFAIKNYNFPLIRLLIRYGALESDLSRKYLSAMCEKGGFSDKKEEAFFELLDFAVSKTGFDINYLSSYINMTLVAGRVDKLCAAIEKFGVDFSHAFASVKLMIIFEAVNLGRQESLKLIDAYIDWMEGAIDLAAATGQDKVLEYILSRDSNIVPSRESVARAVTLGYTQTLKVLHTYGVDLKDELYVKTACRGFSRFSEPLMFLVTAGALKVGYDGRSVFENAQLEGNKELLAYLKTLRLEDIIVI